MSLLSPLGFCQGVLGFVLLAVGIHNSVALASVLGMLNFCMGICVVLAGESA